jgi:AraC-like DNA-binding protein
MTGDRLYLEEGLGIGVLAERLAVPEYRLRRLINRQLGHRNFPAFLNSYRVADAKAALADPARRREPILTIALGLGFGSIGPFNRAFKAATGMTPSAFRQAVAAEAPDRSVREAASAGPT